MQTLVLGATGFIGSNVARALVAHGHCVRVLRRSHSSTLALDGVDVQYVLGDVSDTASLVAAMQDVQAVFHV
ncbi:MAG: NmrA family NAD(P)-binding protein, partial [Chloroflexota bacterium]